MRQEKFFWKWFDNGILKRKWKKSFREQKIDDSGDRRWQRVRRWHDFRIQGIRSREHVEYEEKRTALRTSRVEDQKEEEEQ